MLTTHSEFIYYFLYLLFCVQFKEVKASTIAENGDVQPDDVITKDMPSDLMSTVAEDSNASLQFKKS